jgi:hypothetical protein
MSLLLKNWKPSEIENDLGENRFSKKPIGKTTKDIDIC